MKKNKLKNGILVSKKLQGGNIFQYPSLFSKSIKTTLEEDMSQNQQLFIRYYFPFSDTEGLMM